MKKPIIPYRHKTQYYETDQMGIIHNSNYFRWFEEARTDFMEQIGLPYHKMEQIGLMAAVTASYCEYRQPVFYGDEVIITKRIIHFNGYKMTVKYEVINAADETLHATGFTRHCLMTLERKPVRLEREYPQVYNLFLEYLTPEAESADLSQ